MTASTQHTESAERIARPLIQLAKINGIKRAARATNAPERASSSQARLCTRLVHSACIMYHVYSPFSSLARNSSVKICDSRSCDGLVILAMVIWGLLTLAFFSRLLRFPHSVLAEIRHPVMSSFVSLFPATTMLVAIGFVPWYRPLALGLFSIGVVIQLAYAAWQTAGLWRGDHPEEATTPGLYLPTVANNFISAMACGALGFNDAGLVFLGAGVFSWLSLEPVILQRLRSCGELPTALRTSLGIQLAPALVACSAWLSVNGGEGDTLAKMLFGYGLLR